MKDDTSCMRVQKMPSHGKMHFVKKLSGEEHVLKVTQHRKTDDMVEQHANDRAQVE